MFCQATDKIITAAREELEKILGDRFGIFKSVDDVLMQGATSKDLETVISVFFKHCQKANVKISRKKFQLDTQIIFGGVELDTSGEEIIYTPQDEKLQEVQDFKAPRTKKELQSFLGVVATFHRWNPSICKFSEKLRKLNSKGFHFSEKDWTPELEEEFIRLKGEITAAFQRKAFDQRRGVQVWTDASKEGGLGYVVAQEEGEWTEDGNFNKLVNEKGEQRFYMVTCGSTSLTPAQKNYSILELEMSAIVYALTNARHWLMGAPNIDIYTDHSPLKQINAKFMDEINNPRMVRLLEKISCYNYTIHTIPGDVNKLADFMSRFPRKECTMPEVERNVPFSNMVRRITQGTNKGGLRINQVLVNFARDGQKDIQYQQCIEEIKKGRTPSQVREENPDHPYLKLTEELMPKNKDEAMGRWKKEDSDSGMSMIEG